MTTVLSDGGIGTCILSIEMLKHRGKWSEVMKSDFTEILVKRECPEVVDKTLSNHDTVS